MLSIKKIEQARGCFIYFMSDENKKYLYISTNNFYSTTDKSTIEEVEYNIKTKIILNHRFKEIRETDKFYGLTDYPDMNIYSSYWDDFSKYRQELFGLIELTEDNMTDYLHKIM